MAYGGDHIWGSPWNVPAAAPATENIIPINAVCNSQYPLYHKATQTVWVVCPEDNVIQAIYSLASPEANLTLSSAAPAREVGPLYLPLVVKREGE